MWGWTVLLFLMGTAAQDVHDVKLVSCTNTSTGTGLQWEYNDMAFLIHWTSKLTLYATGSENQPGSSCSHPDNRLSRSIPHPFTIQPLPSTLYTPPDPSPAMVSDSVEMESSQWMIDPKSMQLRAFRATGIRCLQLNSTGTGVEVGVCSTSAKTPPAQQVSERASV
jgi:hypothetical protein